MLESISGGLQTLGRGGGMIVNAGTSVFETTVSVASSASDLVDLSEVAQAAVSTGDALRDLVADRADTGHDATVQSVTTLRDDMASLVGDPSGHASMLATIMAALADETDDAVDAYNGVSEEKRDGIHLALDIVGFVPVVGEAADVANGVLYAAEGDYVNAGISFASAIPVAGDTAKAGRLATRAPKLADAAAWAYKGFEAANDAYTIANASSSVMQMVNAQGNSQRPMLNLLA